MMKTLILAFGLILTGCAALPNTGPTYQNVSRYDQTTGSLPNGAQLVSVDSVMAHQMLNSFKAQQDDVIARDLHMLQVPATGHYANDHTLLGGDKIIVALTSWSPVSQNPSGNHVLSTSWPIQIPSNGTVTLPFLKQAIHLAGLSVPDAQIQIASLYRDGKVFLDPSVSITVDPNGSTHGVLVTGTVGAPKIVPWTPGGMTMAQVLTTSFGGGQVIGEQNDLNGGKSATTVTIMRPGLSKPIDLPLDVVLKADIPVSEQDKIIVTRKPAVQVTVMGGGIANGLLGFDQHPSLAQTLAQSKGLNPATANAKAVFVFRMTDHPTLYAFAFKTTDALVAAQQFPMMDSDIVYVAEAPIVPVQEVLSAIWPVAQFATIAK